MVRKPSRNVVSAIKALARAVSLTGRIYEKASAKPLELYHAREFLSDMEDLLLQQVLTAFPDTASGGDFLSAAGLDYLIGDLRSLDERWNGDDQSQ